MSLQWAGLTNSKSLKVTEQLRILMDADDLDAIFFLSPGQAGLIKHVTDALGIFRSKVNVIIPHGDSEGLDLRLDSRLYLFRLNTRHLGDDSVTMFESYQIRSWLYKVIKSYERFVIVIYWTEGDH